MNSFHEGYNARSCRLGAESKKAKFSLPTYSIRSRRVMYIVYKMKERILCLRRSEDRGLSDKESLLAVV